MVLLAIVAHVALKTCSPKIFFCFRQDDVESNKISTFAVSMSQFVIYIKLEKYLSEWLTHTLGCPVRFPNGSNENAVIRAFILQTPEGEKPETAAEGMTPIYIPDSKAKPPESYNYMTEAARKPCAKLSWTCSRAICGTSCALLTPSTLV